MQGYYQIASFPIAREPVALEEGDSVLVDYIVISRRSRERAGLRYQRRGVDDDAHVANFVETETIMRVEVCSPSLRNHPVSYASSGSVRGIPTSSDMRKYEGRVGLIMFMFHFRVAVDAFTKFPSSGPRLATGLNRLPSCPQNERTPKTSML
jgi:hypothetical protein